jgi:hypothetical protein
VTITDKLAIYHREEGGDAWHRASATQGLE